MSKWFKSLFSKNDLSQNYMDQSIPDKQRRIVDQQLHEMREGEGPSHFKLVGDVFAKMNDAAPNVRLLDAGCASGYYSEILKHHVSFPLKYIGSDYNQAMLKMASQKYLELPFFRMDLQKLAWLDKSFDIVFSGAVIVHIQDWQKAVSEIARVSRRWIVLHRTRVTTENRTIIKEEVHYDVLVYRVSINENELLALLQKLGFSLISRFDCYEGDAEKGIGNFTYLFERKEN